MTTRLNKALKEAILKAVIAEKITPKVKAQQEKAQKIADRTMQNLYDQNTQKWLNAAPEGGISTKGKIRLRIDGQGIFTPNLSSQPSNNYHASFFTLSKSAKVIARDIHEDTFSPSKRDQTHLQDILKSLRDIDKELLKLKSTINAALNACTTLKKLETQYPSLKKYLPETHAGQCTTLPAITDQTVAEALAA